MTPLDALFAELSGHVDALALGSGHSIVADGLRSRGIVVDAASGDWPSIQLTRRYSLVIVEPPHASDSAAAVAHLADCAARSRRAAAA